MKIGGLFYKGTGDYDHTLVYQLAKSFKLSCKLIETRFDEIPEEIVKKDSVQCFLSVTANTNLALSCELILKALILKHNNEKAMGHNLSKLVKKLDTTMQKDIEMKVISSWTDSKNPLNNYQQRLDENSRAFEKLRYLYEGNIGYSFTFLSIFNDVLFSTYEK